MKLSKEVIEEHNEQSNNTQEHNDESYSKPYKDIKKSSIFGKLYLLFIEKMNSLILELGVGFIESFEEQMKQNKVTFDQNDVLN